MDKLIISKENIFKLYNQSKRNDFILTKEVTELLQNDIRIIHSTDSINLRTFEYISFILKTTKIQTENFINKTINKQNKITSNVIKTALERGYVITYCYSICGCLEFIKICKKTIKISDICNNIKYLKFDYVDGLDCEMLTFHKSDSEFTYIEFMITEGFFDQLK